MSRNAETERIIAQNTRGGGPLSRELDELIGSRGASDRPDWAPDTVSPPSEAATRAQKASEAAKAAIDEESSGVRTVSPWFAVPKPIIQAQLAEIRPFVDWVVEVYMFSSSEIRPCWWRHPALASEWMGLWHLYRLSFSVEDSGAGPNNFHYWLAVARQRMAGYVSKLLCNQQEHVESTTVFTNVTVASDEQWREVAGTAKVDAPVTWPRFEGGAADGADGRDRETA